LGCNFLASKYWQNRHAKMLMKLMAGHTLQNRIRSHS
jgi:hypothetical protein